MPDRSGHTCHAAGCPVLVAPKLFMCGAHWRSVPRPLQRLVLRFYVAGQENRMDPSYDYLYASQTVVDWVADRDGVDHVSLAADFGELASDTGREVVAAALERLAA